MESDPVYKLFISDLCAFEKTQDDWFFKLSEEMEMIKIYKFQLLAKICKVTGFNNEIFIISDDTGKAKATRGPRVPGDFSWVKPDIYCSIIGNLLSAGKLPHINIIKLAKLNNNLLQEMWPYEVMELKNFISKKITPRLSLDCQ